MESWKARVGPHDLQRLKVAEVIELSELAWQWWRGVRVESLDGDEDKAGLLEAVDAERGGIRPLLRWALTVAGAAEIVKRGLRNAGVSDDLDELGVDPAGGLQEAALDLLGMRPDPTATGTG